MPGSLINIGKAGALAARGALDVTAQNIANANTDGYSRRSATMEEVGSTARLGWDSTTALSGVRVSRIARSDSVFLHSEARRTGSDLARADAEVAALRSAEGAIEQSGLYPEIVEFEASLARLSADPLNASLRTAAMVAMDRMAQGLNLAASEVQAAGAVLVTRADSGVAQVNTLAQELARTNAALVRVETGSSNQAVLLDQRDSLLAQIADQAGISVQYGDKGQATVRLGDASGPALVSGSQTQTLAVSQLADGTLQYALDGNPLALASGALAGLAQGSQAIAGYRGQLDSIAASVIAQINDAQATGVTPTGSAGQPVLDGTGAADIVQLTGDGAALATAPASVPAGSRDGSNLQALRDILASDGPAGKADTLLFALSSTLNARDVTRDALGAIAETAHSALIAETGVDLDTEATNLLRYQQAFQASGRVIQIAADIFDTLLGIR